MESKHLSVTKAAAYRAVRPNLAELHRVEQTLSAIERVNPDRECAGSLATIRTVLAQLETFVRSPPER